MDLANSATTFLNQKILYGKAYSDALRNNEAEVARWTVYRKEHEELKKNISMYKKSLRCDILIPMGSKALLPGQVYHTGELLISHGDGYFSESSADQAYTIADRRIRLADEMLEKYERERTLHNDKLEAPFISNAFAEEGQEILEVYDEAAEKRWREEHSKRMREHKQREAAERKIAGSTANEEQDKELFEHLEELELLEELGNELDQLEGSTDENINEQITHLMRTDSPIEQKQRIAHPGASEKINNKSSLSSESFTSAGNDCTAFSKGVATTDHERSSCDSDSDGDEESVDENLTPEFAKLLNETKNMQIKEKLGVFEAKLRDVRQQLYLNTISIVDKVDLYQMHEELEEAIDFLKSDLDHTMEKTLEKQENITTRSAKKIHFAEHDEIAFIEKCNDTTRARSALTDSTFCTTDKTLFIPIMHSSEAPTTITPTVDAEIVSPADIYRLFINESKGETPALQRKSILKKPLQAIQPSSKAELPPNVALASVTNKHNTMKTKQLVFEKGQVMDIVGNIVEHQTHNQQPSNSKQPTSNKKMSKFKQQRV
ncbi:unconventional prefoldin RPB5 interactor-like protein [Anopheles albimanus]|uniref:unconventional prefoldin RPB5 interactor-like protein n=1 Tax=Anopheles albimanus TaxID=7167 RepID=UPI0016421023|nr:unconventional prefoldin RPB5 interactor-like protein [Anopheles albimanus]